jgi:hypothetical protein
MRGIEFIEKQSSNMQKYKDNGNEEQNDKKWDSVPFCCLFVAWWNQKDAQRCGRESKPGVLDHLTS